jgi:iron complex transport system substrate-binding protein
MPPRRPARGLAVLACLLVPAFAFGAGTASPHRIVSTSPSLTETLFALGLGDRVVGVSQYCRFPDAVRDRAKVGSFLKPDVEAIARLSPDLVVVHGKADDLEGRLRAVGLNVAAVDHDRRLTGVYALIRGIAVATGTPERGAALVEEIEERLGQLRARPEGAQRPRVLLIIGRRPGTLGDIVAVGPTAYLGELLEIAGGTNVLPEQGLTEYPRISLETVLRLRPDVVIDTGDMGDSPEEREAHGRTNLALWRGNALVAAAGIKRIYCDTTDALVVPGPRVVEATEWLRTRIRDSQTP